MWSNSRCIVLSADVMFIITWTMLEQLPAPPQVDEEADRSEKAITNFMEICSMKFHITRRNGKGEFMKNMSEEKKCKRCNGFGVVLIATGWRDDQEEERKCEKCNGNRKRCDHE